MNRHNRRKENTSQRRKHLQSKTILSEVYVYTGADGDTKYLNVSTLRSWADANLELQRIAIDLRRVEQLLSSDSIDRNHLMTNTIRGNPKPIIVCLGLSKEGDQIVDGNHTYIGYALAFALAQKHGFDIQIFPSVLGYIMEPHQWKPYLLPPEAVVK